MLEKEVSSPSDSFLNDVAFVPDTIGETSDNLPPGDPNTPQPSGSVIDIELVKQGLTGTFDVVFGMIATKRGAHWQLQEFEKSSLSTAWAPLVQMLLAQLGSSEQGMIALALLTTSAVVGGKFAQDATNAAKSMANTKTPTSEGSFVSSASGGAARPLGQSS
jgi:hypothetical protein